MHLTKSNTIILMASMLLVACTLKLGHDFDTNSFNQKIIRGTTTQEQLQEWLGNPANTGISVEENGDTNLLWTYYYSEGPMYNMSKAKLKFLQIKLNKQGIVISYDLIGPKQDKSHENPKDNPN